MLGNIPCQLKKGNILGFKWSGDRGRERMGEGEIIITWGIHCTCQKACCQGYVSKLLIINFMYYSRQTGTDEEDRRWRGKRDGECKWIIELLTFILLSMNRF